MAQLITTIPVFRSTSCGATGTAGTILSDPSDLRDICAQGITALAYSISSTTGTAGSSLFGYQDCSVYDGAYREAGTFGTQGNVKDQTGRINFTTIVAPFIKIKALTGTSAHALFTAELSVR